MHNTNKRRQAIEEDLVGGPYGDRDDRNFRVRIPSVVLRTDGRYGVAHPKPGLMRHVCLFERHPALYEMGIRQLDDVLGRASVDTSFTSGFAHEELTYATRGEAQRRAYALAREIGGDISDWP
jgi:hypothetical protein